MYNKTYYKNNKYEYILVFRLFNLQIMVQIPLSAENNFFVPCIKVNLAHIILVLVLVFCKRLSIFRNE